MKDNKRILVAVDGANAARRTVARVADMVAGQPGMQVALLHLELPPPMLEWGGSEDPDVEEAVETDRDAIYHQAELQTLQRGKSLLEQLQATLAGRGIDVIALEVKLEE